MKCVICHGNEVTYVEVAEELQHGVDIVRVPVHALVCPTCGERYYDRRTIRFLEKVSSELRDGRAELTEVGRVLQYR